MLVPVKLPAYLGYSSVRTSSKIYTVIPLKLPLVTYPEVLETAALQILCQLQDFGDGHLIQLVVSSQGLLRATAMLNCKYCLKKIKTQLYLGLQFSSVP